MPDLVVEEFTNISLDGHDTIAFRSHDPDIGETFEVWFVDRGLLYQVMTRGSHQEWLLDILKAWTFN